MLKSKAFDRLCCAAVAVMLLITVVLWTGKVNAGRQIVSMGYEGLFSQDRVHTINIEMKAEDWESFLRNAVSEEYTVCAVTVDGEKLSDVAIRAKGNTSLSSVAGLGSEKYSFKIEFDRYDSTRTYHGLDKLSLNNLIYDATMMKDYLAYTLMAKMDVPSPLCSYAWVTVNGEDFGLYLAVEAVEDSFLTRNSMTRGELYKPDSMSFGGGRGNGRDFDMEAFREENEESGTDTPTESSPPSGDSDGFEPSFGGQAPSSGNEDGFTPSFGGQAPADSADDGFGPSAGGQAPSAGADNGFGPSSGEQVQPAGDDGFAPSFGGPSGTDGNSAVPAEPPALPEGMPAGFGGFNFGMGNADVKLQYIDENADSYSNIFNNAKTKINKRDQERLIESLRKLSARENLQDVVFSDEIISYLVVHDFVRNGDSYTGSMVHNYYLYEEAGHLAIIPWDYNLGFGGFTGSTNGKSTVNSSIDSPVDGSVDDRPLVAWIFHDETALNAYHQAYETFVKQYIESGWGENGNDPLSTEISRVAAMIRPYVEKDPNGFYDAEDFDAAVDTMQAFCDQRGRSILDQLAGKNASELNYGDGLDLSAMGTMNNGMGGPGGMPGRPGNRTDMPGSGSVEGQGVNVDGVNGDD